eukprot:364681-Chlamydomonas_euryale.AAC.13
MSWGWREPLCWQPPTALTGSPPGGYLRDCKEPSPSTRALAGAAAQRLLRPSVGRTRSEAARAAAGCC